MYGVWFNLFRQRNQQLKIRSAQPSFGWAWPSSAPACFFILLNEALCIVETKTLSLNILSLKQKLNAKCIYISVLTAFSTLNSWGGERRVDHSSNIILTEFNFIFKVKDRISSFYSEALFQSKCHQNIKSLKPNSIIVLKEQVLLQQKETAGPLMQVFAK